VSAGFPEQLWRAFPRWWREQVVQKGIVGASITLAGELAHFLRDSAPDRRRQRYGDMEYDWEHRVNTTGGTVAWRERFLGFFHSAYQPTDPSAFREMMASVPVDFSSFTFIDLGSGKGRTLLMASDYPFHRIIGVEIMPELNRTSQENIRAYNSPTQQCTAIDSVCDDATEHAFPDEPLVIYLFNPLPEEGLRRVLKNLESSLQQSPRMIFLLYHNALLDSILDSSTALEKIARTDQYSLYRARL